MIIEKVTVKDFDYIAKTYKHYLWHFLQKEQYKTRLQYFSYFDKKSFEGLDNPIIPFVDNLEIPYFESYAEESYDFLMDNRISGKLLYQPRFDSHFYLYKRQFYTPIMIGFEHYTKISATTDFCYCGEGFSKVLLELDPLYLLNMAEKLD